jgi:K+-transporting ATPase ATPase A chain
VQNLAGPTEHGHDADRRIEQTLQGGPVASQESIKMLGTNGGGFFNANSAHPFENPTAWTNHPRDRAPPPHPVRAHRAPTV